MPVRVSLRGAALESVVLRVPSESPVAISGFGAAVSLGVAHGCHSAPPLECDRKWPSAVARTHIETQARALGESRRFAWNCRNRHSRLYWGELWHIHHTLAVTSEPILSLQI